MLVGIAAPGAAQVDLPPGGTFIDDNGSVHEADIEGLAASGITSGCAPTRYCPGDPVTRGQMAAFLHRALGSELVAGDPVDFGDDDDSVFEADIEWLASVGVTTGCAPDAFCPDASVTRGQMAAFLVRALDLPATDTSRFTDTSGSVFADDIDRLAAAGITAGCTPTTFCPDDPVTRAQMASFLVRALDIDPIQPPPPPGSEGCGLQAPSEGRYTVTVGDDSRYYLLDIPDGYDPDTRYPLMFGFHGAGGTADDFRSYSRFVTEVGDEAIVVFPDAGPTRRWLAPDDLEFFDAIHEQVTSTTCVNVDRVFTAGHSSGGFMSNTLACQRGDVIRGVGSAAGGGPFAQPCDGPVAAWITHASNDPIVPFVSGEGSRDTWIENNGCDPGVTEELARGVLYDSCDSGVPVAWVETDILHLWPSWAAAEMWAFFELLP